MMYDWFNDGLCEYSGMVLNAINKISLNKKIFHTLHLICKTERKKERKKGGKKERKKE